jgi:hypothetical protein
VIGQEEVTRISLSLSLSILPSSLTHLISLLPHSLPLSLTHIHEHEKLLFGELPAKPLLSDELLSNDLLSSNLYSGELLSNDLLSNDLLSGGRRRLFLISKKLPVAHIDQVHHK